jgi:hypothetical protein
MIRAIQVKRQDPPQPGGFALRLEFQGTGTAHFEVGGTLADPAKPVQECAAGDHPAEHIVNEGGQWFAAFRELPPGDYLLTVKAAGGGADQVHIRIEAKE